MSVKTEPPKVYSHLPPPPPPPPLPPPPQLQPPSFPATMDDEPRMFHSLPPMSELLGRDQGTHEAQRPVMARQFHAPYNMVKQPLWLSTMDLNAPASRAYQSQPQINSHFLQGPPDPVPSALDPPRHTLAVPQYRSTVQQQRIVKKISQRRGSPKDQEKARTGSAESPVVFSEDPRGQPPVDNKISYDRRDSGAYESSPRPMGPSQSSRSVPISGLLSDAPRERAEPKYILRMRQQPIAARACGFGERDRRVIDPPPILQMHVEDPNASPEELRNLVRQPWAVVHCVLWDPIADRDDTAMPGSTDKRQQRRLMGTLVSSPFVGNDEHGVEGCFFAFPDLSVRTPGTYSLKFSLVLLNPARMFVGSKEKVKSAVWSSTFHVYNAKDFSGMRASSALTKSLKLQGCLISVKKGNAGKNNGSRQRDEADEEEDEEDDEDDGQQSAPGKRGKRVKR